MHPLSPSGGLLPLKDEIFHYASDCLKLPLGVCSSKESAVDSWWDVTFAGTHMEVRYPPDWHIKQQMSEKWPLPSRNGDVHFVRCLIFISGCRMFFFLNTSAFLQSPSRRAFGAHSGRCVAFCLFPGVAMGRDLRHNTFVTFQGGLYWGVWDMATLVKIHWSVGGSTPRAEIYEQHPVLGSVLGTEEGETVLYKSRGQLRK